MWEASGPLEPRNRIAMRSKRYQEAKKLVDSKKTYAPEEAFAIVKKTANTKFDATIELHVHLGIAPKKGEQQVSGTLSLPHGTGGKSKKVMAIVSSAKEKEAKEAGADIVGGEELIEEIAKTGKLDYDIAEATPDMMPKLAKVAKILGPKGLMPNPKTETVGADVKKMVGELKKGKIAFKTDDGANIHFIIGKASFSETQLLENAAAAIDALKRLKPASSKGIYLLQVVTAATMGPGVKVSYA